MDIERIHREADEKLYKRNSKVNKQPDDGIIKPDINFIQNTSSRSLLAQNRDRKNNYSNFKEMVEVITELASDIVEMGKNPDIMDSPIEDDHVEEDAPAEGGDDELLNILNEIFTPILVMQGFEDGMADRIQEAFSEASVLMEKNIIQFDDATKMAQLISVCALLIARQKNSQKYQMYLQGAKIRNAMKLEIQKDEYDAAKSLAQKFLVKVSTTNNSSIARNAANELLPETQH